MKQSRSQSGETLDVRDHRTKVERSRSTHHPISAAENFGVLPGSVAVGNSDQEIHAADPVQHQTPWQRRPTTDKELTDN